MLRAVVVMLGLVGVQCFQLDDILQIVNTQVHNEACKQDFLTLVREFYNSTAWAVQMMDATGKVPSGLLRGNLRQLGDFDECITAYGDGVQGQYCLASFRYGKEEVVSNDFAPGILQGNLHYMSDFEKYHEFHGRGIPTQGKLNPFSPTTVEPAWLSYLLDKATAERRHLEIPVDTKITGILPVFSRFEWGVCVPASCTATDVQGTLKAILQFLNFPLYVQVPTEYCQSDRNFWSDLDRGDYIMMLVFFITLVLVLMGTAYDWLCSWNGGFKLNSGNFEQVILAFSVITNWRKLTSPNISADSVGSLDGIRALCMLAIVCVHRLFFSLMEPFTNKKAFLKDLDIFSLVPFSTLVVTVDSFFAMSGFLRGYHMLQELEDGRFHYLSSLIQRYLRLCPPYFIVMAFSATLLPNIGSGPLWYHQIEMGSEFCQETWVDNVLYINNYHRIEKLCMPQSWYLSCDMQLFIIAPLIIYSMWMWPKIWKKLLIGLIAISVIIPMVITFIYRLPAFPPLNMSDFQYLHYMKFLYFRTHNRMSSYIVGLGLAYVLHHIKNHQVVLSKIWVTIGWATTAFLLLTAIFYPYKMIRLDYQYNVVDAVLYGGLHRLAWGIGIAWVVFACHKGYGGIANSFLNIYPFRLLSRLSYCVYLTHLGVMMFHMSRMRNPSWYSPYSVLLTYISDLAVSLVISVLLHLGYEAPSLAICRIIFCKGKTVKKTETDPAPETDLLKELKNGVSWTDDPRLRQRRHVITPN